MKPRSGRGREAAAGRQRGEGQSADRAGREHRGADGRTRAQVDGSQSDPGRAPGRLWLFVVGVLLVTMPAITLVVAYAALTVTRSVALERLTPVEAVELYLVELAMFALFSYLLYRLTGYAVRRQAQADAEWTGGERRETTTRPADRPGTEQPEVE